MSHGLSAATDPSQAERRVCSQAPLSVDNRQVRQPLLGPKPKDFGYVDFRPVLYACPLVQPSAASINLRVHPCSSVANMRTGRSTAPHSNRMGCFLHRQRVQKRTAWQQPARQLIGHRSTQMISVHFSQGFRRERQRAASCHGACSTGRSRCSIPPRSSIIHHS